MKRSAIILSFGIMAIAACQRQELETSAPVAIREVEFVAELAGGQTRTHFDADFKLFWSTQESINVFYGPSTDSPGSLFVSQNTEPSSSATFRGTIESFTGINEDGESYSYWGVYPYSVNNRSTDSAVQVELPTVQTGLVGNIDDNTALMVAKSYGLTLRFHNVGTLFRLTFSSDDIKAVTFRGNNGEIVSGKVNVTMNADGEPEWERIAGEGKTYIQLKAPNDGTFAPGAANEYYIVTLPQTFSNGVTVTYQKADGSFGSYKVTSSVTCDREGTKNLKLRDAGVTFSSYVDMGNGLKIATVNIGGDSPEDAGERFAWGETTTKLEYTWDNYFWGTQSALSKYTTADGKAVLDPEDDPTTVICGEDWRTPTREEWQSLLDMCDVTFERSNRITLTNRTEQTKTITLYARRGTANGQNYYWTSSSYSNNETSAGVLSINNVAENSSISVSNRSRYLGYYIRPIYARVFVQSVSLSQNTLELYEGQSATLTAIINPENATKKNVIWESDNPNVATVDENGTVTAIAEGETTIFVSTVDGNCSSECLVTVNPLKVWMGNGYWAICNLGAESPEELGDMYAWGETETKDSDSWSTYKWMMNSQSAGKYITKYQFPDGNTSAIWYDDGVFIGDGWSVLRSADDVAKQKLGGFWHIPSRTQWLWLMDNCDWDYDDEKLGYWVTSRASGAVGNKIFLPAHNTKSYWSNVVDGYDATLSSVMFIRTTGLGPQIAYQRRSFRNFIRPVYYQQSEGVEVALNKTAIRITETGNTETLTAIVSPSDALETSVVWSSSDPSIATVARNGTVTAVSNGTTTIIARAVADFTETATCTVSVGYPVTGVTLNKTAVRLITSKTTQLTATISPTNAANKAVTWSTSNSSVATVTNGLVTAVSPGSATITVTTVDGGFTATCTVKVNDIAGTLNGHEWVDMGNGVKWARTNIGSNTELVLGNLYAWGETYAKSDYTLANYEFYSGGTYSKYNSSDKKTVLDSVDDAATQNWGSGWRTPTDEEWRWLKQNCEWRYDSYLKVYVVTCSEPGYENYGIVIPVDELYVTYYWSANRSNVVSEAFSSQFSASDYTFRLARYRYYGSYVRPVAD